MDIEDVHKNVKLLIDNKPYNIDDVDFVKPGKGRAIYRLKLRNLLDNTTLDRTYHSAEKVEEAPVTTREEQYLYREGDNLVFMNTETFEQMHVPERLIGERSVFLKEGTIVTMLMLGEDPIDVTLPAHVDLVVVGTDVAIKTATITSQNKGAKLETGATVGVPAFIKEGDVIKVDTRSGTYVERVGTKK